MNVDKPRRDHLASGIDDARSGVRNRWRYAHNRIATNRNIAAIPRAAATVHDPAVAKDQVVGWALGGGAAQKSNGKERDYDQNYAFPFSQRRGGCAEGADGMARSASPHRAKPQEKTAKVPAELTTPALRATPALRGGEYFFDRPIHQNRIFAANWIWRCAPVCDWNAARWTAPKELLAALSWGKKKFA